MRNLFMSLLLIIVLAWAYQSWVIEPDNPVSALHVEQDYPRLTAVQLSRPASPVADSADEAILAENEFKCLDIGPIVDKSDAESIAERLRGRDMRVQQTARDGQVWVGHWVQVIGLSSRMAAEAARSRLIAAGLSDAYIVSGSPEPKISLGVFKGTASADITVSRARALGFDTRIEERYQPGTQYWLGVQLPAGRSLQPGELRSDAGQILRTETVPCEAAAG